MGSGCGNVTVEKFPSSAGQLPVPVALNAASPTLFRSYYTQLLCNFCAIITSVQQNQNQKNFFEKFQKTP